MRHCAAAIFVLCIGMTVCAGVAWGQAEGVVGPGLRIDEEGRLLLKGQPYRGIGVNYFDLFARVLKDPDDTTHRRGLEALAEHGIPFARAMWGGYYPGEWKLYFEDKEAYFARMDLVVKAAEETGVGLVPSLFFAYSFTPDLVGESRNAWGEPGSKTHALMRGYVEEVVTRYRDSAAIWAWEFANEFNLDVDLPNAAEHRPPVLPDRGTASTRSADDDLDFEDMRIAFEEFAKAVRKHDRSRPVTHGASLPRPAGMHLRRGEGWVADSREELQRYLLEMSPDPVDLVSVHMYPFDRARFGEKDVPYAETLRLCAEACARAKKALFVGEFGAGEDMEGGHEAARREFEAMVKAIEGSGVPLAAVWVFDLKNQTGTHSISPDNNRAYMLEAVAAANRRMAAR